MIYSLDASGQTQASGTPQPLWPAGADGSTKLFIQNRSNQPLSVIVFKTGGGTIEFLLPARGDYIDESYVDPTLAVSVESAADGHGFTAVRIGS